MRDLSEGAAQAEIAGALTQGLLAGFAGEAASRSLSQGPFAFRCSNFETQDMIYHDQWLEARTGGGQELLMIGEKQFTRLYAGGVVSDAQLKKLGITERSVINFLKLILNNKREETRTFNGCLMYWMEWSYTYTVIDKSSSIPLTVGREVITYKGEEVFVHIIMLCPVT